MKIEANGISMNYELSGFGNHLTMIHGAGDNLNVWYKQVPGFSENYRVLTYDVRGHGQTELPEGELTMELWVEDLHALLKALKIRDTFLLGYSMGGGIALEFTIAHPEMVKGLILSNSGGAVQRSEEETHQMEDRRQAQIEAINKEGMAAVVRDRLSTMFSPGFAEANTEAVERYQSILLENSPEGYLRVMQGMVRRTGLPDLSKINCPTLIIAGEHDAFSGPAAAKAIQESIKGSPQVKILPTGHASFIEQPAKFNLAVLTFLTGVEYAEEEGVAG